MLNPPRTLEQAQKTRYEHWGWRSNTKGRKYLEEYCAYVVWSNGTDYQCSRKPGHGPAGLYCKQHAKCLERESNA